MDFDPRDYDSRDDERFGDGRERGGRGEYRDRDDDDLRLPEVHSRDHDDEGREPGRGSGDDSRQSKECVIEGRLTIVNPFRPDSSTGSHRWRQTDAGRGDALACAAVNAFHANSYQPHVEAVTLLM